MPNDAKLGLVLGVGLVIAVAVIYFRKDSAPASVEPAAAVQSPVPSSANRVIKGKATSLKNDEGLMTNDERMPNDK